MTLPKANILRYPGVLENLYIIQGPSAVEFGNRDGISAILAHFDKVIIDYPTTTDERNAVYQIITSAKLIKPSLKIYGYTVRAPSSIFAAWALQEANWHTTFGSTIDGIYVEAFDANDLFPDTYTDAGMFTRAEQILAVDGIHDHGYELFAESAYPELTLGPASQGEAPSTVGVDPAIQDCIIIKPWFSDDQTTGGRRGRNTRLGTLNYLKSYSEQDDINLYTAISYTSTAEPDGVRDYVPINQWLTLHDEKDQYGINGFAVYGVESTPSSDWFYTNKQGEFHRYDPRSLADNGILGSYGDYDHIFDTYAIICGTVLPGTPQVYLAYERSEIDVDSVPAFNRIGTQIVTPDTTGYFEVLLPASTTGSEYTFELSTDPRFLQAQVKTVTMTAGESYDY